MVGLGCLQSPQCFVLRDTPFASQGVGGYRIIAKKCLHPLKTISFYTRLLSDSRKISPLPGHKTIHLHPENQMLGLLLAGNMHMQLNLDNVSIKSKRYHHRPVTMGHIFKICQIPATQASFFVKFPPQGFSGTLYFDKFYTFRHFQELSNH